MNMNRRGFLKTLVTCFASIAGVFTTQFIFDRDKGKEVLISTWDDSHKTGKDILNDVRAAKKAIMEQTGYQGPVRMVEPKIYPDEYDDPHSGYKEWKVVEYFPFK